MADISKLKPNGATGTEYNIKDADAARNIPTFTEASTRANIASGESMPTILGKIQKFFSDLKDLAFIGKDGTSSTKYLRGDGTWQTFPTIPAAQVNSDWNAASGVAQILNKPTIPTVNNGTLTIQKNGTQVATFSANQSGNATANIVCADSSEVEGSKVATGNPITITDASPIKAEKIEIGLEPKQAGSGTPSPSNIRAISGYTSISANRCGKNKLSPFVYGVGLNATNGSEASSDISMTTDYIPVDFTTNPNYYLSGLISTVSSFVAAYNANHQFLGRTSGAVRSEIGLASNSFTGGTPQGTGSIAFLRVTQYNSVTAQNAQTVKAQLEIGLQPTQFEPYAKEITIQFGQTIYGGKLTILQDGSADVYVDKGFDVYDGSNDESWTRVQQTSASAFLISGYASNAISYTDKTQKPDIQSNYLSALEENATWGNNNGFITTNINLIDGLFYIGIQSITTVEAWRTYLASNNLQVAYKLATPFTIHLSQVETLMLLQGINNVWTDGTTLSLTYQPDNAIGEAKGTAQDAMAMVSALASTAIKVYYKKGQYDMSIHDWVDMPSCSLTLDKGIYFIMGWCNLTGDNYHYGSRYYRYGCAIADSSNNRLVGNTFMPDSNQAYEASISTCFIETIAADATVRKLKGYMGYSDYNHPIKGGIIAIKIA